MLPSIVGVVHVVTVTPKAAGVLSVKVSTGLVLSGIAFATPLLTSLLTKVGATHWLKTLVAIGVATLGTIAAVLGSVPGYDSVGRLIILSFVALAFAGGSRISWVKSIELTLAGSGLKIFGIPFNEFGLGQSGVVGAADRAAAVTTTPPVPWHESPALASVSAFTGKVLTAEEAFAQPSDQAPATPAEPVAVDTKPNPVVPPAPEPPTAP